MLFHGFVLSKFPYEEGSGMSSGWDDEFDEEEPPLSPKRKASMSPTNWVFLVLGGASIVLLLLLVVQKDPVKVPKRKSQEIDNPQKYAFTRVRADCGEGDKIDKVRDALFVFDHKMRNNASKYTIAEEISLGQKIIADVPKEFPGSTLLRQGTQVDYITRVAQAILPYRTRKKISYQFYVLENAGFENAFALPGGHIIFTSELYQNWLENEAQLATILSHEIIHVDQKHTTAAYEYARQFKLSEHELSLLFINLASRVFYSSKRESESDALGVELMHKAGYSVFQSVRLWEKIAKSQPPLPPANNKFEEYFAKFAKLFASHPNPRRRACLLKQQSYDLYQRNPLAEPYIGKRNWQAQKAKSEKRY